MKIVRECTREGCGCVIAQCNKTGLCHRHYQEWRIANRSNEATRTCEKCSTTLRKENVTGRCAKHKYEPKECACGKKLPPSNKTGQCRTCRDPINLIPPERREEYALMRHRLKNAADAVEWIRSGKYVAPSMAPQRPTKGSAAIIAYVAAELDIPVNVLCSPRRFKHLLPARAIVTEAMRRCNYSFTQIGMRLGGKDHSTAVHYRGRFIDLAANDASFERIVRQAIA